jgi:OHCU decarboxylase
MDHSTFVEKFGAAFEHSPWVAEAVFKDTDGLTGDADALCAKFEAVFLASDPALQLATLRAHPQLVCALGNPVDLTTDSASEQSAAGLDQCSADELAEFSRLNREYSEKFGFPFIIAVKGFNRKQILDIFRKRLNNNKNNELIIALQQTCKIARFRIMETLDA